MKIKVSNYLLVTTLLACSSAFGQEKPGSQTGYNIWAGLDAGVIQSESDNEIIESSKSGALFGGKAIFSRFSEKLMLEAGLGWQASRLKSSAAKEAILQSDIDNGTVDREVVETRSGLVDFGVRYRQESFEIGAVGQILFGADTTYSPYLGVEDTTPNGMAGLSMYYTFYGNEVNQRLGLQLLTDVTIDKRQISSTVLQYYVSLPFLAPKPQEKVIVKYKEKTR
jgi:hypothetical protein